MESNILSGKTWSTGFTGTTGFTRSTRWTRRSGQAAGVAAATSSSTATGSSATADTGVTTVTSLTGGTVSTSNGDVLQALDFSPDVLGGALAEDDFIVHLSANMMNIIVDHGKGDTDGEDCDNREGDGGIRHEAVSFNSVFKIHGATFFLWRSWKHSGEDGENFGRLYTPGGRAKRGKDDNGSWWAIKKTGEKTWRRRRKWRG